MNKEIIKNKIGGVIILLLGIMFIWTGATINEKLWFTVIMTIIGTTACVLALQYLARKDC